MHTLKMMPYIIDVDGNYLNNWTNLNYKEEINIYFYKFIFILLYTYIYAVTLFC